MEKKENRKSHVTAAQRIRLGFLVLTSIIFAMVNLLGYYIYLANAHTTAAIGILVLTYASWGIALACMVAAYQMVK